MKYSIKKFILSAIAAAVTFGAMTACTDYESILEKKYQGRLNAKMIECDDDIYGTVIEVKGVTYKCFSKSWHDTASSSSEATSSADQPKSSSSEARYSSSQEVLSSSEAPVDTVIDTPEIYQCEDGEFVLDPDECL